ncbi:MAG: DUF1405 domain-containing protein [Bacillaceae bacterium]
MLLFISHFLKQRSFLILLLVINIFGTIYGYYWYNYQLVETKLIFWPFVPDSPTASLFFCFVLIGFLLKRNWGLIEALAIVTLFKYGIWAVVMNLLVFFVQGSLDIMGLMLIFSHLGMAIQGLLYAPYYRIKPWHLAVTAIFVLHNEIIDYVFGQMPRYSMLDAYMSEIGYFTFWLSILSIFIAYYLCIRKNRYTLSM